MFNNTDTKETLPLKISKNLPKNSVGISFFESKVIDPNEIIQLVDESNKIDNNNSGSKPNLFIKNNNAANLIRLSNEYFNKFLVGETLNLTVTNRFKEDEPLFYKMLLSYPIKTQGIPNKNNISFVDNLNYQQDLESFEIVFENILDNELEATDLYNIYIYTNEKPVNSIYAIYNGFKNGKSQTNLKEELNFENALEQNIDYELIKKEEAGSYKSESFVDTVAYIKPGNHLKFSDKRNKIEILYKISSTNFSTTAIKDFIINPDFALGKEELNLPNDDTYNEDLYYLLSGKTPKEYFMEKEGATEEALSNETFKFEIIDGYNDERIDNNIIINFEKSGDVPIGVKVFCNTGHGYNNQIKPDESLRYDFDGQEQFNRFAIKINDTQPIQLEKPLLNFSDNNWNVNINYGYFYQKINDNIYKYVLDDIKEKYDKNIGLPYNKIIKEKPLIINSNMIKTKMNNICNINDSLEVYKFNQYGIKQKLKVDKINSDEGLVYLDNLNKNDELFIDYHYIKNEIQYNGYYNSFYDKFVYLDLKPTKDNFSVLDFMNNKVMNNLFIINRPIYFYLKPKYLIKDGKKTQINDKEFIYHTFEVKDLRPEELLIGKVIVSPNISKNDIETIDIRKEGGGIKPELKSLVNTEDLIDTNNFWDYGYWNGTPYNENNVVVINIDDRILKSNGGKLSKENVMTKVKRWIGAGNLPIINYVKSYKSNNLDFEKRVEKTILNKLDYDIKFFIETYRTVPKSKHLIEVYRDSFRPQLNIDRIDEPVSHEIKTIDDYQSARSIHLNAIFEKVNTENKPLGFSSVYDKKRNELEGTMKSAKKYRTVGKPTSSAKKYNTMDIKKSTIEIYEK